MPLNTASTSLAALAIADAPTLYERHSCCNIPPVLEYSRQQEAQIRSYQAQAQARTEAQLHTCRECPARVCPDAPTSRNSQATRS